MFLHFSLSSFPIFFLSALSSSLFTANFFFFLFHSLPLFSFSLSFLSFFFLFHFLPSLFHFLHSLSFTHFPSSLFPFSFFLFCPLYFSVSFSFSSIFLFPFFFFFLSFLLYFALNFLLFPHVYLSFFLFSFSPPFLFSILHFFPLPSFSLTSLFSRKQIHPCISLLNKINKNQRSYFYISTDSN